MRALILVAALGCAGREPAPQLDLGLVQLVGEPRLRTDTVGEGVHAERASFVLIDAKNASAQAAYITLGGELTDGRAAVGTLKPQSLYVPAGEARTFALIDHERKPRPASTAVRIVVRGATVAAEPPPARIEELHSFDDGGRVIVQGHLVNDAPRDGNVIVIAAFHDGGGRPLTRPYALFEIGKKTTGTRHQACTETPADRRSFRSPCTLQFVGPPGSKRGTIYVGDVAY